MKHPSPPKPQIPHFFQADPLRPSECGICGNRAEPHKPRPGRKP